MDQAEGLRRLTTHPQGIAGWEHPTRLARVIAITSGKGGVGKTNLAVNLSVVLAQRDVRVGLLDADLGLANVDILLGISPEHTLADVMFGNTPLSDTAILGPAGVIVYPGGTGLKELADISGPRLEYFLQTMAELDEELDILFIDTAAGIGHGVTSFLAVAQELIVVTTPEPTSITDAYAVVKTIGMNNPDTMVHLIVNKARSRREAETVCHNLNLVLQRFSPHPVTLHLLGYLPFDNGVTRAVIDQVPLVISQPNSLFSRSLKDIADSVQGHPSDLGGGVMETFRNWTRQLRRDG